MKELWTANPFCLMNRPFAEMGYNSSGLNRAPSVGNPPTLHAPSACFRRTILRPSARHLPTRHKPSQHTAQHLTAPCKPSAVVLRSIWRPPAQHPPSRCAPSSGPCTASVGSLQAICPPVHRAIPASPSQTIRHRTAQHPPTPARHPLAPCRQSAGTNRRPNDPQNKPSARAGALNPRTA